MEVRKVSGILADTTELKKMIMEHPDYQIAVLCGEECNSGDYTWMYASDIMFGIGEILYCEQPVDECVTFCDRGDFYDELENYLWEKQEDRSITEEEFQVLLAKEKDKYEPYWRNCIFIYANN